MHLNIFKYLKFTQKVHFKKIGYISFGIANFEKNDTGSGAGRKSLKWTVPKKLKGQVGPEN